MSLAALLYRARQLGKLPEPAYRRAMQEMSARGWRRQEPGDVSWDEAPTVLADSLELLERGRGISRQQLLAELQLATEDFDSVVETVERTNIVSLSDFQTSSKSY